MDRVIWQTTVHGVSKSWAHQSDSHTQCFFQTLISLEISTPKAFIHNSSSQEGHPGIPYQMSPPSAFHFLLLCLIFRSHFLPATNIIYLD